MRFHLKYIGKVRSQQRPRHRIVTTKSGRQFTQTYDQRESRDFKATLHLLAQQELIAEGKEQITGPCRLVIDHHIPIPKNFSKKKRELAVRGYLIPTTKPDVDNVAKGVMDALNGVLYVDDKLVAKLYVRKSYAETEGLDVFVEDFDMGVRNEQQTVSET